MSQSSWLAAALIGGFVLWLALNGKLPTYWDFLKGGGAKAATPAPAASSSDSSSGGGFGSVISGILKAVPIIGGLV